MQEKNILINSIQKLIKYHISNNEINQHEIFNSLNGNDFKKMLIHLQDDNLKLRCSSLRLILELLYRSQHLKSVFCSLLGIHPHIGRIALNGLKPLTRYSPHSVALPSIFSALKHTSPPIEENLLFWYIDVDPKNYNTLNPYQIKHCYKMRQSLYIVDPYFAIVGFYLDHSELKYQQQIPSSIHNGIPNQVQLVYRRRYFQPAYGTNSYSLHSNMKEMEGGNNIKQFSQNGNQGQNQGRKTQYSYANRNKVQNYQISNKEGYISTNIQKGRKVKSGIKLTTSFNSKSKTKALNNRTFVDSNSKGKPSTSIALGKKKQQERKSIPNTQRESLMSSQKEMGILTQRESVMSTQRESVMSTQREIGMLGIIPSNVKQKNERSAHQ